MTNISRALWTAAILPCAIIAAPAIAQQANSAAETVIVTGTRVQGMTAADSSAPITVLGSDALTKGTGSTDLRETLGEAVPSFTAQQFGVDISNLSLSASLDGLSPNETLVLVNGHRRHYTGNLSVAGGGAAPDISLIPKEAVDHIEVLRDGAAAQYGTDAIAGVINIILKDKSSGGQFAATGGQNYSGGGQTYDAAFNMGLPLSDKGVVNVTISKEYHNHTLNAGTDSRYVNAAGPMNLATVTGFNAFTGIANLSSGVAVPPAYLALVKDYPRTNRAYGDAEFQLTMAALNSRYDFSDSVEVYAFGTFSHRGARGFENNRQPNQIIAMPGSSQPCSAANPTGYNTAATAAGTAACALGVNGGVKALPGAVGFTGLNSVGQIVSSGQAGNLYTPGVLVMYPAGFDPMEGLEEDDYQYNVGVKFDVLNWKVDANIGYGKDLDAISTLNSANRSLFIDTHTSPTNFYDGRFTASQFTGTIDAVRQFNVGMASPLNVALGFEAREDGYAIGAGDSASYYKEGVQAYPGFTPSDAGAYSRKNYAGYIDFALAPIEELQIDIAGRAEHFTDFGDTQIGKITARYDFNPRLAVRGTISTGFRAPNLGEEHYSATVVSPLAATVQLPADSAAAKILGIPNLAPEVSTSYSVGIVAHPMDDLSVTLDAYSIALGDRITKIGGLFGEGGVPLVPLVNTAILAHGNALDPTVSKTSASAFVNGYSTLTQGVDLVVNYPMDLYSAGMVTWTLAGNFNQTSISRVEPTPAVILAQNAAATFFTVSGLYNIVHSSPQQKVGLSASWSLDEWGATIRETYYGPEHGYTSPSGCLTLPACFVSNQAGVGITDLEVRYTISDGIQFALGANNIFSIRPDIDRFTPSVGGVVSDTNIDGMANNYHPLGSAFSQDGGFYYGRITYNF